MEVAGGGMANVHGTPVAFVAPFADRRRAIQSIYWVTMIARANHGEKPRVYRLFQKRSSAAATSAGRSAIAQCPAPSITVSGVPVRAAKRSATASST